MDEKHLIIDLTGPGPFGFRLLGGEGDRFTVVKIRPGSKAEASGIKEGDLILAANGDVIKDMEHSAFMDIIDAVQTSLELVIFRCSNVNDKNIDVDSACLKLENQLRSTTTTTKIQASPFQNAASLQSKNSIQPPIQSTSLIVNSSKPVRVNENRSTAPPTQIICNQAVFAHNRSTYSHHDFPTPGSHYEVGKNKVDLRPVTAPSSNINRSNDNYINRSNVGDMNRSNVGYIDRSNVDDMNRSNADDMNRSNVGYINRSNVDDMNRSNVDDMNKSNICYINRSNVGYINRSNVGNASFYSVTKEIADGEKRDYSSPGGPKFPFDADRNKGGTNDANEYNGSLDNNIRKNSYAPPTSNFNEDNGQSSNKDYVRDLPGDGGGGEGTILNFRVAKVNAKPLLWQPKTLPTETRKIYGRRQSPSPPVDASADGIKEYNGRLNLYANDASVRAVSESRVPNSRTTHSRVTFDNSSNRARIDDWQSSEYVDTFLDGFGDLSLHRKKKKVPTATLR